MVRSDKPFCLQVLHDRFECFPVEPILLAEVVRIDKRPEPTSCYGVHLAQELFLVLLHLTCNTHHYSITDRRENRCESGAKMNDLGHHLFPLSLIHISEPTRLLSISYAVFC